MELAIYKSQLKELITENTYEALKVLLADLVKEGTDYSEIVSYISEMDALEKQYLKGEIKGHYLSLFHSDIRTKLSQLIDRLSSTALKLSFTNNPPEPLLKNQQPPTTAQQDDEFSEERIQKLLTRYQTKDYSTDEFIQHCHQFISKDKIEDAFNLAKVYFGNIPKALTLIVLLHSQWVENEEKRKEYQISHESHLRNKWRMLKHLLDSIHEAYQEKEN